MAKAAVGCEHPGNEARHIRESPATDRPLKPGAADRRTTAYATAADSVPIVVDSYIGIHADVGGQPVALALDTGAQEMMLDSMTAQRLGSHLTLLPRVPGEGYTSISGQFVPVVRGTLDRLTLGATTYDSLPVLVGQQNLLGGTALLGRHPFALNLRKSMLYLWRER